MSDELEGAEADVSAEVTTTPEPTPVTIVEKEEPSLEEELSKTFDKATRHRGADGKFASRDGDDDTESAAPDEYEGGEDESADQSEEDSAATSVDAPDSWPAEMVEKFNALPAEVSDFKEFVAQRDMEQNDAIALIGQEIYAVEKDIMKYEPFDQVTEAFRGDLERRGIQPAQAFHFLLNANRILDQNPLGGIVQIGRSYGIDLMPLLQHAGVQVQMPQQANPVEPYVAALQSKVQQLEGTMTAQKQQQDQAEEQRLNSVIADFSKDKPYFEEVRKVMAALIQGKQAHDLASAYDMAINASPEVRKRIQQDARNADGAKQKAKADAARKSTAVNVRSGTPGSPTPKNWADDLESVARKHYG